jgi:hypothetical protein
MMQSSEDILKSNHNTTLASTEEMNYLATIQSESDLIEFLLPKLCNRIISLLQENNMKERLYYTPLALEYLNSNKNLHRHNKILT